MICTREPKNRALERHLCWLAERACALIARMNTQQYCGEHDQIELRSASKRMRTYVLSRAAGGTATELPRPFCAGAAGLDRSTIFVAGAWKPFMANTRPFGTAAGPAYADGC